MLQLSRRPAARPPAKGRQLDGGDNRVAHADGGRGSGAAPGGGPGEGSIGCWASAGPGSLGLTPAAGAEPGFFVMISAGLGYPDTWYTQGLRMMTTTYPIKPPLYAVTKSVNYLPNVLMQMEALERGLDNGIFIDEAGNVGESSNMNVAFMTADGTLKHPKFDDILSGCTSL